MKILLSLLLILFIAGCASTSPIINQTAASGDLNTLKKIQAEGQNINQRDDSGATPLMYAIWSKQSETSKYLINSGADIHAKDNNGYNALMWAVDNKQYEIINILIEKGVDLEAADNWGRTPLAHAVLEAYDIEAVRLLISKGAKANTLVNDYHIKDAAKQSLLALSIDSKQLDIAIELISAGADLHKPFVGMARVVFLGEELILNDMATVSVGPIYRYLKPGYKFALMDINPGDYSILIAVTWPQKQPSVSFTVTAGNTYYFKIKRNHADRIAGMVGGLIGKTIVEVASNKGPYEILPLDEVQAKEKINTLINNVKSNTIAVSTLGK